MMPSLMARLTSTSVYIAPSVGASKDGGIEAVVTDDGPREKRLGNFEVLAERANALNGRFEVEQGETNGTTVRVTLPAYVAQS